LVANFLSEVDALSGFLGFLPLAAHASSCVQAKQTVFHRPRGRPAPQSVSNSKSLLLALPEKARKSLRMQFLNVLLQRALELLDKGVRSMQKFLNRCRITCTAPPLR
jgi:hypothetical protein